MADPRGGQFRCSIRHPWTRPSSISWSERVTVRPMPPGQRTRTGSLSKSCAPTRPRSLGRKKLASRAGCLVGTGSRFEVARSRPASQTRRTTSPARPLGSARSRDRLWPHPDTRATHAAERAHARAVCAPGGPLSTIRRARIVATGRRTTGVEAMVWPQRVLRRRGHGHGFALLTSAVDIEWSEPGRPGPGQGLASEIVQVA